MCPVTLLLAIDFKTFMVDDVLCKVDRATMSVSLEGREPLLDHRIAEYLAQVPSSLKYKNKDGKYLLRKILYKHLPQKLMDKPKSGFTIPLPQEESLLFTFDCGTGSTTKSGVGIL